MKSKLIPLILALCAEVANSWWRWIRASTDGLRLAYDGSFWIYESQRLAPWFVIFAFLYGTWLLVQKRDVIRG